MRAEAAELDRVVVVAQSTAARVDDALLLLEDLLQHVVRKVALAELRQPLLQRRQLAHLLRAARAAVLAAIEVELAALIDVDHVVVLEVDHLARVLHDGVDVRGEVVLDCLPLLVLQLRSHQLVLQRGAGAALVVAEDDVHQLRGARAVGLRTQLDAHDQRTAALGRHDLLGVVAALDHECVRALDRLQHLADHRAELGHVIQLAQLVAVEVERELGDHFGVRLRLEGVALLFLHARSVPRMWMDAQLRTSEERICA